LYNVEAKTVYKDLYHLVKDKNYFVITTNVDGQFRKAGFKKDKVFEVQGSLSKIVEKDFFCDLYKIIVYDNVKSRKYLTV